LDFGGDAQKDNPGRAIADTGDPMASPQGQHWTAVGTTSRCGTGGRATGAT